MEHVKFICLQSLVPVAKTLSFSIVLKNTLINLLCHAFLVVVQKLVLGGGQKILDTYYSGLWPSKAQLFMRKLFSLFNFSYWEGFKFNFLLKTNKQPPPPKKINNQ